LYVEPAHGSRRSRKFFNSSERHVSRVPPQDSAKSSRLFLPQSSPRHVRVGSAGTIRLQSRITLSRSSPALCDSDRRSANSSSSLCVTARPSSAPTPRPRARARRRRPGASRRGSSHASQDPAEQDRVRDDADEQRGRLGALPHHVDVEPFHVAPAPAPARTRASISASLSGFGGGAGAGAGVPTGA